MYRRYKTVFVLIGIISIAIVVSLFFYIFALFPVNQSEPALSTPSIVDIDYTLPPSANIIWQDLTTDDFFGDYSYCASFELPESEIENLIQLRFDWITSDGRKLPTEISDWRDGVLPDDIHKFAQGFGECKKQVLDKSKQYKYLYKMIESGQERIFVIDKDSHMVYYHRSSW